MRRLILEGIMKPRRNAKEREFWASDEENSIHPEGESGRLVKVLMFGTLFVSIHVHSQF